MRKELLASAVIAVGLLAGAAIVYVMEPTPQPEASVVKMAPLVPTLPKPITIEPLKSVPVESAISTPEETETNYLLAQMAVAEAEDQGIEGQALVMRVILNRVEDGKYPDTVEEVIFQDRQFSSIDNGRFDSVSPNEDSWEALEMINHGWDESQGALFFESGDASAWHRNHLKFLFEYGDHRFYTRKEAE